MITDDHTGVDNYRWLAAIDSHPDLSPEDWLAALDLVGGKTGLTDEEVFWGAYHLETYGLLRSERQHRSLLARLLRRPVCVKYVPIIPDRIITDAELDREESWWVDR